MSRAGEQGGGGVVAVSKRSAGTKRAGGERGRGRGRENGGKPWWLAVVGGNSLQSTRSAFNNALPRTPGDLEREPITVEWNRMVFGPLSSP